MSRPRLSCRFLAIAFLLSCCVLNGSAAQTENAPDSLQPGKLVQRELANGEAHSYALNLATGQYAYVVVNQKGVDVVVTAYRPDGTQIAEMDGPTHNHGLEAVFVLADSPGTYRVEVKSQTRRTGPYEIKLEQLRIATGEDRSRVAAQKLFAEAMALRDQRTEQSYQQAIEKHLSAITIWHDVNDKLMEGRSLLEVGEIYGDTGQYQKALDSYSQARTLFKTIGSLTGEANVMNNTAWIYGQLEDNQKALETYDQVAEIYRTVGDIDAVAMSNIGSSYAALGDYKRALEIHLRVLEMRRATNERARGNLIEARKFIEEALERAESLRYRIGSPRLRATYFASVHRTRDIYMDLLMRLR